MPSTLAISSRVLATVEDLPLLAATIVEGYLDGLHRSPFLGYSTEFSAYRSYTPGDNLRHLDWKVWARTDELYIKQFEDDTNLRCQIYLDTSASMDFGAGDHNKFHYARVLSAALAHLMVRQRDAPGLILFGPESRQALPAASTRHQATELFVLLSQAQATGPTMIGHDLFGIVQTFSRRGLAVVLTDFFTADDTSLELLKRLHAMHQEAIVFHVMAPEELDLPYEGEWVMEDSETREEVVIQADDYRAEYRRRVTAFCDRIQAECRKLEFDYQRLRTDQPLDAALGAYLERRAAM